nr:hypothetical protein [Streptomyces sp. MH191]
MPAEPGGAHGAGCPAPGQQGRDERLRFAGRGDDDGAQRCLRGEAEQPERPGAVGDGLAAGEHHLEQSRIGGGRGLREGAGGDGQPFQDQVVEGARGSRPFQPDPARRAEVGGARHPSGAVRQGGAVRSRAQHAAVRQFPSGRALGQGRGGPQQGRRVDAVGGEQRLEVRDHPYRGGRVGVERGQPQQQTLHSRKFRKLPRNEHPSGGRPDASPGNMSERRPAHGPPRASRPIPNSRPRVGRPSSGAVRHTAGHLRTDRNFRFAITPERALCPTPGGAQPSRSRREARQSRVNVARSVCRTSRSASSTAPARVPWAPTAR